MLSPNTAPGFLSLHRCPPSPFHQQISFHFLLDLEQLSLVRPLPLVFRMLTLKKRKWFLYLTYSRELHIQLNTRGATTTVCKHANSLMTTSELAVVHYLIFLTCTDSDCRRRFNSRITFSDVSVASNADACKAISFRIVPSTSCISVCFSA